MRLEMRCVYCGVRLDPWPCNGCGKFLTALEMSGECLSSEGTRCDESYTREFDDLRAAKMWAGKEAKKHTGAASIYEQDEFNETLVWSP